MCRNVRVCVWGEVCRGLGVDKYELLLDMHRIDQGQYIFRFAFDD